MTDIPSWAYLLLMSQGLSFPMDFPMGRIFGVSIRIHITLIIYGYYIATTSRLGFNLGLVLFVISFASVLLHEFGHVFATRAVGGTSGLVVLWPLGGLAFTHVPHRPFAHFFSTICGPLVNVLLFIPSLIWLYLRGAGLAFEGVEKLGTVDFLVWYTAVSNLAMLIFNLIPAYPMDGGRILQSMLWPIMGYKWSMLISSIIAIICYIVMLIIAIWYEQWLLAAISVFLGIQAVSIVRQILSQPHS